MIETIIETKKAPVHNITSLKTFDGNTLDITENKRIRNVEIVDITDNDRLFLKEISTSYKESNDSYDNEIQFFINLHDIDIDLVGMNCIRMNANTDLVRFIDNLLFENIFASTSYEKNKPIFTHLHIFTHDLYVEI